MIKTKHGTYMLFSDHTHIITVNILVNNIVLVISKLGHVEEQKSVK